jgi:D-cysteine desulfhydrase
MLGLFPGGNKTRKLEFLVADALEKGADTLITCGAPQSNHCRITLAAAVKEGLKCRFVIEERVPDSYDPQASGNNFMFRLMGVEAITVVPGGTNMAAEMQKVADALAAEGRKGYIIPGGGSNALGGLGYVACAQELQQQLFETACNSTAWWSARAARARTAAWWPASWATTSASPSPASASAATRPTRSRWCTRKRRRSWTCWAPASRCPARTCRAWAASGSPSTRSRTAAMVEAVQMLARTEGIPLDPVYTGKIMAGLIGLARQGVIKAGENVLFLHTGGLPSLHAYERVVLGDEAVR